MAESEAAAARRRQLRPRAPERRCPRARRSRGRHWRHVRLHEPAATRLRRRGCLRGEASRRSAGRRGRPPSRRLSGRPAVRRAGGRRALRLPAVGRTAADGREHLPSARRDPARARARSRSRAFDEPGGHLPPPRAGLPAPRREHRRPSPPQHLARHDRLVLRPAHRRDPAGLRPDVGVQGIVHRRVGPRRVHCERQRARGHLGTHRPRRSLDARRRARPARQPVPDADHAPRVRRRQAHRDGGGRRLPRPHAAFYVATAEEATNGLLTDAEALWTTQLSADFGNLQAAHAWAIQRNDLELEVRLLLALWNYGLQRLSPEYFRWVEEAMAALPLDSHDALRSSMASPRSAPGSAATHTRASASAERRLLPRRCSNPG